MADPTQYTFAFQLFTKIRNLAVCAPPVAVFFGEPSTFEADSIVSIGAAVDPVDGKERFAQLGAVAMWEEFYVSGTIVSWAGGDTGMGMPSDLTANNAQLAAYQNAVTIFNGIFEALRADVNFSVANGGTPLVLYCRIEDIAIRNYPEAGKQYTAISFKVYAKNRISAT